MSAEPKRTISTSRLDLVSSILAAATLPHERSLAAELVVEQTLDRIGDVGDGAGAKRLAKWLDDAVARYADLPCLTSLLTATWRSVSELSDGSGSARDPASFAAIGAMIETAAKRPRALAPDSADEQLDEIDACLAYLIGRLSEHDPITAEHSKAVSSWCARIARKLGFSQSETLLVKRGGLAHDIGKIGTPESILMAPRALTPEEWSIMRRHTIDGAGIVADLPLLADFVPAIRSHHERLDGNGYPDGLRGDAIPLSARVVAVADCFNAMIGRRPYRPPLAPSRAIEVLRQVAGDHLDPEIVEAMVSVVTGRP